MKLIPYQPGDSTAFVPQFAQAHEPALCEADMGRAWSATEGGRILGCGGLVEMWDGRAYAWALLARDAGPHMLALTRALRFRLDAASFARVEMVVDAHFAAGVRWAQLLGFELETPVPLRSFLPGGRAAFMFARFR